MAERAVWYVFHRSCFWDMAHTASLLPQGMDIETVIDSKQGSSGASRLPNDRDAWSCCRHQYCNALQDSHQRLKNLPFSHLCKSSRIQKDCQNRHSWTENGGGILPAPFSLRRWMILLFWYLCAFQFQNDSGRFASGPSSEKTENKGGVPECSLIWSFLHSERNDTGTRGTKSKNSKEDKTRPWHSS